MAQEEFREIEIPTGTILEFPLETPDDVMVRAGQKQYAREIMEDMYGVPVKRSNEILQMFDTSQQAISIPQLLETGKVTFQPTEPRDPMFAPEVPPQSQIIDLMQEVAGPQGEGFSGGQAARVATSQITKNVLAAVETGADWLKESMNFWGMIPREEIADLRIGRLPLGEGATFDDVQAEIGRWAADEYRIASPVEAFVGDVANIAAFSYGPLPLFKWGSKVGQAALQSSIYGLARAAESIGGQRAAAGMLKWITAKEPGWVTRTIRGVAGGGGAFGLYSHAIQDDPAEVWRQILIGGMTGGVGAAIPTKIGNFNTGALRVPAEAAVLATSSAVLHGTDLTVKEFGHTLAFLVALSAIRKSGELTRAGFARSITASTEAGVRDGWLTAEQARAINNTLKNNLSLTEQNALRRLVNAARREINPNVLREQFADMVLARANNEALTPQQKTLWSAFRLMLGEPEMDSFFPRLPAPGDIEPRRPASQVRADPPFVVEAGVREIREAETLPFFLEEIPQKGILTDAHVYQAMGRAAKRAGQQRVPDYERRWISHVVERLQLEDKAVLRPDGSFEVPFVDFVRGVLRATPSLKAEHTKAGSLYGSAADRTWTQERYDEIRGADTYNVTRWESPIAHGVTNRNFFREYGLDLRNLAPEGSLPDTLPLPSHSSLHSSGRYLFHTNWAYSPRSQRFYVLEMQNDHARTLSLTKYGPGLSTQQRAALARLDDLAEEIARNRAAVESMPEVRDPAAGVFQNVRQRMRQHIAELQDQMKQIRDEVTMNPEEALQAAYEGLGLKDPSRDFMGRAFQESLRQAAQHGAKYLLIPHVNLVPHIQGWATARSQERGGGRLEQGANRIVTDPAEQWTRRHFTEEGWRKVKPILERYKELPKWVNKNYDRKLELFHGDHGFLWWRFPVQEGDKRATYALSFPKGQRGFIDLPGPLVRGAVRLREAIARGLDAAFGPPEPPRRPPRAPGEPFDEQFRRERVLRDVEGVNRVHIYGYTMLQLRHLFGGQVPELEAYTRDVQEKLAPHKGAWQDRAIRRQDQLRWLPRDEYQKLQRLVFEEVLAGRQTNRHFNDEEISRYQLQPETERIFREMKRDFRDFFTEMRDEIIASARRRITSDESFAEFERRTQENFAELLAVPYFPFSRFGRHTVQVTDRESKRAIEFYAFDRKREAKSAEAHLRRRFADRPDIAVSRGVMARDALKPFMGLPTQAIDRMRDILREEDVDVRSQDFEHLVKELLPDSKFARRMLRRKALPGFSSDIVRAYSDYFFHGANHLMRLKWGDALRQHVKNIDSRITDMKAAGVNTEGTTKIRNYMVRHFKYMWNPGNELAGVRGALFDWFLGYNVSSAMVNLTQIPLASYPYLAARYGDGPAVREIARAARDVVRYLRTGRGLEPEIHKMLREATAEGFITESQGTELAGTSEGRQYVRGAGILHKPSNFLNMVHTYAPTFFKISEQFNRRVTFVAAARLARERSPVLPAVYKKAREAVNWTQGEYVRWNRPAFMRGKASVIFLFQQYVQHMLVLAAHDPAAPRFLGMLALMGGVTALPFMEEFLDILDVAVNKTKGGDMFDIRKKMREALTEADINPVAVMRGLGGLGIPGFDPALDMSARLSLGRVLPGSEALRTLVTGGEGAGLDVAGELVQQVPGAAGGAIIGVLQALGTDSPYTLKTYERAMPNALRYLVRGSRYLTEGREIATRSGATLYAFDEPTERYIAALKTMIGFSLTPINEEYERRNMIREHELFLAARQNEFAQRLTKAILDGDSDMRKRVFSDIDRYNADVSNPAMRINKRSFLDGIRKRIRNVRLEERRRGRTRRQQRLVREINSLFPYAEEEGSR